MLRTEASLCGVGSITRPIEAGSAPIDDRIKSSDCRHLHVDAVAIVPDRPRQSRLCEADQARRGSDCGVLASGFTTSRAPSV
jgi:hypothetical protein